jgi:hypothetical protein
MDRQIFIIFFVLLAITACGGSRTIVDSGRDAVFSSVRSDIQNVQVGQSRILPAYGVKVVAEIASLKLRVSTSKEDTTSRLDDIQNAIEHISSLAAENSLVNLEHIDVSQVSSSADRATPTPYIQNLDTSSITLKLSTDLAAHNHSLTECLIVFNDFLNAIDLPDTISIRALSVETELSDPETYRRQLIAQVYQELDSIQEEYGKSVKFEITGLHSGLQMMKLTDTEYYIYLEPNIVVSDF